MIISIVRILLATWMFAALAVALLNVRITRQNGNQGNAQELECFGNDEFPHGSPGSLDRLEYYCTYYYEFSGDDCRSASMPRQGRGVAGEGNNDACGPLYPVSTSQYKNTVIICFCNWRNCNTRKNVQMMMTEPITIKGVYGFYSTIDNRARDLFQCMKEKFDQAVKKSKKGRKKDGGLPISVGLLVVIIVGSVLLIGTIVVLIPFLRKWHKARHKKWLEETWEERVRQAAKELNVQNSKETGETEKAKYDKKTRAGRKALKTLIESKEGSKESQEKGSKDDLFPMAIGPNEQRPSAEKFSAEPAKGSAEAGGFPERGFGGFGAPVGRGFSNEAQGMGVQ
ncbi:unnamed protein product [Cylicocyclus nassatus]|uniref:Uncharacterized protein n=1 Tax=Cylicocyclus nassatus TaxID=53992 RepID=A0AA36DJH1_CYLNA|nr:unnamed protein product [Cylicocyclus nassatus]